MRCRVFGFIVSFIPYATRHTVKTGIIEWCAMICRWEFPTLEKGAKNKAKEELLNPSERHEKNKKKHQTLPEESTLTT